MNPSNCYEICASACEKCRLNCIEECIKAQKEGNTSCKIVCRGTCDECKDDCVTGCEMGNSVEK